MADYPTTLPLPDYGSYSGVSDKGLVRTSVSTPAPTQIQLYGSPRHDASMVFSMTNDVYADEWLPWVDQFGYDWFNMPVVSPYDPVQITSTHRCRMTTDLQLSKRGDNWLSVSVGVEILQGDKQDPNSPTSRVYDAVNAGVPSNPSTDRVIAGTPANPSTDTIQGNLYAYTLEP